MTQDESVDHALYVPLLDICQTRTGKNIEMNRFDPDPFLGYSAWSKRERERKQCQREVITEGYACRIIAPESNWCM
jgi:hypothetical protein